MKFPTPLAWSVIGLGAVVLSGLTVLHSRTGAREAAPQTARVPQFDNQSVKVWKTTVAPHQATELHRHDHPRVIVALTDGTMDLIGADGQKETHVWKAGEAYWLPAMPPNAMHIDSNPGDKPLQVMVVELEQEK
jgi:beta-alanine degradation protein BauB